MDLSHIRTIIRPVGHLPFVRGVVERLGILEVIDDHCPLRFGNKVSDAECVGAMILNILSGRVALYRMEEWLALTDVELLLGEGVPREALNDTRLARALDYVDAAGTDTILGAVVLRYLAREDRPTEYTVHQDTTSISLWGAYDDAGEPVPTYGYSKDRRPDLKQLVFGLTLHGSVGIPMVHSVTAGNTPDQAANRDHLAQLSKMLPDDDEVTVVADCKLVDADTLGRVLGAGFHLVSLVPDTFTLRRELIDEAWDDQPDAEAWPELARTPGRRKDLPHKVYRGRSVMRTMPVLLRKGGHDEAEPVRSVEPMRFLVVHSTKLAEKFDKSLPKKLERERKTLDTFVRKAGRKGFDCESDARAAAAAQVERVAYHHVETRVVHETRTLKRSRRGRPRNGEDAPTHDVWTVAFGVEPDQERIGQARRRASCFVLITDHLEEAGWDDVRILSEYRHQYMIEGHCGFRWLKSEAAVAPMFLKTPSRMRAMGLVFVLALMVRNYIQFTMRGLLRELGQTLPHPFTKKEVDNLTTEMAFEHFADVHSVHLVVGDDPPQRARPSLRDTAVRIVELLGHTIGLFARPPPRRVLPAR